MSEELWPCPQCGTNEWTDNYDVDLYIQNKVVCVGCGIIMRRDHIEELVK
jgi:transcription initiation factor TFIIIB Brf1 subunit/transcription initiation factor TFIIB